MKAATRRPRTYHHGDLRAALLAAALSLIEKGGPDAVGMREVARRARVSEAAPYHHFRDKEKLLAAASAESFTRLAERMRRAAEAAGPDPGEAFVALGSAYLEFGLDEPGRFRLLFGRHMQELGKDPDVRAAGVSAVAPARELAARWVAHAGASLDPLRLFRFAWGQIHGTTWLVLEREIEVSGREEALGLLREGLRLLLRGAAGVPNLPKA